MRNRRTCVVAVLVSIAATVPGGGCSGKRAAFHPTATSEVLEVGSVQREGVFARDRWHQGLEDDRLRGAVIRISVDRDGTVSDGSGVALCQIGAQIYILTAKHVPFPRSDDSGGGRRVALRKTYRFELARSDVPPVLVGLDDELSVKRAADLDVALVQIAVANDSIRVAPVSYGRGTALAPGAAVRTFGYASRSARGWEEMRGSIVSGGGDLAYSPAVEPGFSGGPVFDANERLVGINLSTDADRVTRVLPIETAVAAIDRWLPPPCSRPR